MKGWGIRARVLFLALAPSVLILVTLVAYFTTVRIAEVDAQLAQRGASIARQLAPGAEFALFAGDRAALQRMTDAAAREADVISVTIVDRDGQVLARTGPPDGGGVASVRFTQPILETRLPASALPEQVQATDAPQSVGQISVAMSRAAAHAHRQQLLLIGLGLGMLSIAFAILLSLAIGGSVVRPIRRLADAMRALSERRPAPPLSEAGGGELKTLAEGFNDMAQRLDANARELQARIDDATRELTAQKDAAEQATHAKSRFIAAASHDLRQPLHAIGLFTGTLQRRTQGTELEPVANHLGQAVLVMDRLFDSLLDISRLDAGAVVPEPRPFHLERLFAQLAAEHADAAEQQHLRLHVRPTSAVVMTDELLLHRLLSNLVANAIRYTERGSVMLCARPGGADVRIEVRDSGVGIPADKHSDIFQEFYQLGNSGRERRHGLGLGLAIVARLARLLDTVVGVRSAPGRGSVFFLSIPRASTGVQPMPEETIEPDRRESAAIRVLIVDDDPLVLAGNEALLKSLGCDVTAVATGAQAKAALTANADAPALILCDLWLGGGESGIDVLRALTTPPARRVLGILISGDTRPEIVRMAKDAGFLLLHKPVPPAKLRAIVANFAWKLRPPDDRDRDDEDPPR